MAAAAKKTQLEQLAAEFGPDEHKTRSQGGQTLTYISIDATINRINEVLGSAWSTKGQTVLVPRERVVERDGDKKVIQEFVATTELHLTATIDGAEKTAYGFGAMVNTDPDMAGKTALAEAIKKAGHQLGIGLYLWDPAARDRVNAAAKRAKQSDAVLKQAVYKIAKEKLGKDKPSVAEMAKLFGVAAANLSDKETLLEILAREEA